MPSPNQAFEADVRLSQDYLRYVSPHARDTSLCERTARIIRNAPIDIPAYFAEHGNLDNLNVPGIGAATRVKLLPILIHGIEAVLRMNSIPVDLPLDKAVFQKEAQAAVRQHRDRIREEE